MSRFLPARAITFAALLACAGSANAQQSSTTEMPPVRWSFVPSVTFSSGYDDNVLLAREEQLPPDDYVNAIVPAGALNYFGRRLQLQTSYQGSFVRYVDLDELNSEDQAERFSIRYRTSPRVTVFGAQSFVTASTTDAIELVGTPFRRYGNRTFTGSGGAEARVTERTTVKGEYAFRMVRFNENVEEFITFPGGHEHMAAGTFNHALTPRVSVGATYDLRRVFPNEAPQPILIQNGGATTELRVSPMVTLTGNLGLSRVNGAIVLVGSEGISTPKQLGIAFGGGINARLEHAEIIARYQRSMLPAFGFGGTFQNEEFTGSVRGSFARNRAYWQQTAAWRGNEPLIAGPPVTRTVWLSSTVGYSVVRWLRVEGYYTRARQDTQRAGGQVDRNRFGFQIVTSRPFRLDQ